MVVPIAAGARILVTGCYAQRAPDELAAMPGVGLTGIYGAVIAGGLFGLLVVPFVHKVLRFFPSVVTGSMLPRNWRK